jgi:heparin binding hemagglutinin HbhA
VNHPGTVPGNHHPKEHDMAKARFDIPTQIPTGATRPLYAGVGMTDLVVETVRDYVADVQKRLDDVQKSVSALEAKPEVLRDRAGKAVADRLDSLNKDAVARRRVIEQRVAELQSEVQAFPTRLQKLVDTQVSTAGDTYADLVKRGETLVGRIRRQQSTQDAESAAKTTVSKAKTTRTQGSKAVKKTTAQARKTAAKSPAKSSAKATTTAAKKTATNATKAVVDAAEKVGD